MSAQTHAELLTVAEMGEADRLTIAGGTAGIVLMENAGRAVADAADTAMPQGPVLVLCGPGNNGGDGFVAARLLQERGRDVELVLFGSLGALKGDAALAAQRWKGPVKHSLPASLPPSACVIDAIFGAGLSRPLEGEIAQAVAAVNESGARVIAVDVPSGVDGNTGEIRGSTLTAQRTVTFFRKKPGHLLFPGRAQCGDVLVRDIGIGSQVLEKIKPAAFENGPARWRHCYPLPRAAAHKYARGHVAVFSGGALATGAARLAARGALRVGAGLVTMLGSKDAAPVLAMHATALMVAQCDAPGDATAYFKRKKVNAAVLGPGQGVGDATVELVAAARAANLAAVIDADALTSCASRPDVLKGYASAVLTPHEGEFARLFPDLKGDKLTRARAAAGESGAVVLLKGADTVIAAPTGEAAINTNAPPWLATAGAGDVLAGFIAGLMAQGMSPFDAACAGAWLHGAAAQAFGLGLIAEDLSEILPKVLQSLFA